MVNNFYHAISPILADVLSAISHAHNHSILEHSIEWCHSRPFSDISLVKIDCEDDEQRLYLTKRFSGAAWQFQCMKEADTIFSDNAEIFQLMPIIIEEHSTIICRYFRGRQFRDLMQIRQLTTPAAWWRRLLQGAYLAGLWLGLYHQGTPEKADTNPLLTYVLDRSELLSLLPARISRHLLAELESPLETGLMRSHGDYMMQNLLFNDEQICVIDIGLASLGRMPPQWDVASFQVSVERLWRFNRRAPLHWLPALRGEIEISFLKGYGAPLSRSRDWFLCGAVRHFGLLESSMAMRNPHVMRWHLAEVGRNLGRL